MYSRLCGSPSSKSILESFHPLAIFGQIFGFFPIQNVLFGFISTKDFKFHLFSLPLLYSIILNLISYSIAVETTFDYWAQRRNLFKFSTDAFAIQIFLAVYLFLRFTLHLLCILRAPKVLQCLRHLELYDEFYKFGNGTTLLNRYLLVYLLGTTVNIVGNVSASAREVWKTVHGNFHQIQGLTSRSSRYFIFTVIPSPDILFVACYAIHIFAEAALFFSHCCITFIISGICDRVASIRGGVRDLVKDQESFSSYQPSPSKNKDKKTHCVAMWINQIHAMPLSLILHASCVDHHDGPYTDVKMDKEFYQDLHQQEKLDGADEGDDQKKKLKRFCSQYIALVDITTVLNDFAKETMAVFTAGSAVMLVALFYIICILLTQHVPMSSNRIKENSEIIPIVFIAVITFLRLLNFINIGEKLRADGLQLTSSVYRLYSPDLEVSSLITHFQHVASKLKLSLSAGGFFVVRRTVITSIVGPILTFIVILAQFRAADIQLHYNTNGTLEHH